METETNKLDNDFDNGFHNWIASAMVYEWYEKHGKPLPRKWKKRFDDGKAWVNGLSADDYDRLIH
jgi:hypothetical protein